MILRETGLLLRHEVRLALRDWLSSSNPAPGSTAKRRRAPRWAAYVFIGLLWAFLSYMAGLGLGLVKTIEGNLPLALISAALVLQAVLMLAQAISTAVETIYVRADLDFLFTAPVRPASVLGVRMAGLAFRVGLFWLSVTLGAALFSAISGDWRWLGLPWAMLGLALVVVGIGLLTAERLLALLGAKRARGAAQVVSTLVGASIAIGAQLLNFGRRDVPSEEVQRQIQAFSRAAPPEESWLWLPARAFTPDLGALVLWLGVCALVFGYAALRFARRFRRDAADAAGLGRRRTRRDLRTPGPFAAGLLRASVGKELRLLLRNPLLVSAVVLPFLYFLVAPGAALARGGSAAVVSIGAVAVVWISVIATRGLVGLSLLTEDAPDLVAAAPVKPRTLETAKLLASVQPVLVVVALGMIPLGYFSPRAAVLGFLGAAAASFSAALIAVRRGAPRPRKDLRAGMTYPKLPLSVTIVGGFMTSAYVSAVALALSPVWPAALLPALFALGLTLAVLEDGAQAAEEALNPADAKGGARRARLAQDAPQP